MLNIVKSYPPNIDQIRIAFPKANLSRAVFCYGDILYNPHDGEIDDYLLAHETIHYLQQTKRGITPAEWWSKYLADPAFRLSQEVEAYRTQYKAIARAIPDREIRSRLLHHLATDLSSPLYDSLCTLSEAKALIRDPQ